MAMEKIKIRTNSQITGSNNLLFRRIILLRGDLYMQSLEQIILVTVFLTMAQTVLITFKEQCIS